MRLGAVVKTTAGAVVTTPDDDEMQVEAVEVTTGGSRASESCLDAAANDPAQ